MPVADPFAVHADGDAVAGKQAGEAAPVNCEQIGVEDRRRR